MNRARLKLIALVIGTMAASALMAWKIADAVTSTQQTAGVAARQAGRAAEQGCYETDTLLWHLDGASYAGYQRDEDAAAFLRNGAASAFHKGSAVIVQLADVFEAAAREAYWQPLVDCQAARAGSARLGIAVPISTVPKQTIQQVLAHPPVPPTSG